MKLFVSLLLLIQLGWAGSPQHVVRVTKIKYQQESCWSFCNLVTEMPWDTALGLGPDTKYVNIEGEGAIVAVVDKTVSDTTLAVGVTWGCSSKRYRVHYYRKNSRGHWYEVERKSPRG